VPSRKQRRRREKSFRHEYETVLIDEEGNEQLLDPDELRAERETRRTDGKTSSKAQPAGKGKSSSRAPRAQREPPLPTWQRAFKRGGLMGAVMFVLFAFVLRSGSEVSRVGIALLYAVAFIPMTYYIDRWAYRSFQRRAAQRNAKK
jgi:hypothetical protein